MRTNRLAVMAALSLAMMPVAGAGAERVIVRRTEPPDAIDLFGALAPAHHPSSPNGGRHGTVARAKRVARKRRNQLRARGHHRQAVR